MKLDVPVWLALSVLIILIVASLAGIIFFGWAWCLLSLVPSFMIYYGVCVMLQDNKLAWETPLTYIRQPLSFRG